MVKRKGIPIVRECVICTVSRISPFAAWCKLDEYPNLEGIIHVSEVAGKWVYDIKEFVKEGKQYVAKVVRIEPEKNLVHLSLKRVSSKEQKEKLNNYRKEQRAEKILEQIAKSVGKNIDQAYDQVGYLLQEKYGDLYSAFVEIKENPEKMKEMKIDEVWIKAIEDVLKNSLKEKETTLKVEINMKSYEKDGVERIKSSLKEIEKETQAKIKYISAPKYRLEVKTNRPKEMEKALKTKIEKLIEKFKSDGIEASYTFVK